MRVFTIFALALSAMLCFRTWVLDGLRVFGFASVPGETDLDDAASSGISATGGSPGSFSPGLGEAASVSPSEDALWVGIDGRCLRLSNQS